MSSVISKTFLPSKNNLYIWLNAVFLVILLLIGKSEPLTVVVAYFLETVIIGVLFCFKMYFILSFRNEPKFVTILEFISSFLFLIAVQIIFVFAFLKFYGANIKEVYYLVENLTYVFNLKGMFYVLGSIIVFNIAKYFFDFHLPKRYKDMPIINLKQQPFKRLLIQQLAVLIACFFFFFIHGIMVVAVLLILIRTWLELYFLTNLKKKKNIN